MVTDDDKILIGNIEFDLDKKFKKLELDLLYLFLARILLYGFKKISEQELEPIVDPVSP
jgi:hypothetical protein